MATTTPALLSFEEFEHLPDQPGKRELLQGELIELPPAESKHNRISHDIHEALKAAIADAHSRGEAAELGEVFIEMGYFLPGDGYLQPDVSVTHAGQPEGKYLEGAPAIAIEIVSPFNTAEEMDAKVRLYFQHGAREVWRLYRKSRSFTIHTGLTARTITEEESVTTPLLPGFALPVKHILS